MENTCTKTLICPHIHHPKLAQFDSRIADLIGTIIFQRKGIDTSRKCENNSFSGRWILIFSLKNLE